MFVCLVKQLDLDLDTERIKKSKIRKGYESWCWYWIWERAALRDSKCAVTIMCLLLFYKVNTLNFQSRMRWWERERERETRFSFSFFNWDWEETRLLFIYWLSFACAPLLFVQFNLHFFTFYFLLFTTLVYIISKKN